MESILKVRSESESIKSSRLANAYSDRSLPRGEYFQNVIGPKLAKNPMQPQPISHISADTDDNPENSPGNLKKFPKNIITKISF